MPLSHFILSPFLLCLRSPETRSICHQWINKSTFTDKSLIILNSQRSIQWPEQRAQHYLFTIIIIALAGARRLWAHRRRLHALGELFYFNCAPPVLFLHWTKPWIRHYSQLLGNSVLIVGTAILNGLVHLPCFVLSLLYRDFACGLLSPKSSMAASN